jgi:hypothetical protein
MTEIVNSFNGSLYWDIDAELGISMTDLQIVIPDNARIVAGWQVRPLPSDVSRSFNVSQAASTSTIQFLLGMWPVNSSDQSSSSQSNIYFTPDNQSVPTLPIMEALYRASDPALEFEGVANSTSNYIRGLGDKPQTGTSQVWVTHIHVRWGFVVLLVLVFVTSCIFTSLSILETRKLRLPAWKENTMPVLTYGLDGKTRAWMRSAGVRGEHRAKKTVVGLVDERDGLELKS